MGEPVKVLPVRYRGRLFASKSLVNRAVIIKSHAHTLELVGETHADDVEYMRGATAAIERGERRLHCGEAGTVIRFLAARVSRLEGEFQLLGSPRLLSRPMRELDSALGALGVEVRCEKDELRVCGNGWSIPEELLVDCRRSSQFATAILINAWGLDEDLNLRLRGLARSRGYWNMSLALVRAMGMDLQINGERIRVPARSKVSPSRYEAELDMDSAFALAAAAALSPKSSLELVDFPLESLQPSAVFVKLLSRMAVPVEFGSGALRVQTASALKAVEFDLSEAPDLFPILSVLCAYAKGTSVLTGLAQLKYKESDRLANTRRLLEAMGVRTEWSGERLMISGAGRASGHFRFDPDQDHRMAMAAGVAKCGGAEIDIREPGVVSKSFPEFWDIVREAS